MKKKLESHYELNQFQLRNISILMQLYKNDAVTDEIVEQLRQSELDYFGLVDKYSLMKYKFNIEKKSCILTYIKFVVKKYCGHFT